MEYRIFWPVYSQFKKKSVLHRKCFSNVTRWIDSIVIFAPTFLYHDSPINFRGADRIFFSDHTFSARFTLQQYIAIGPLCTCPQLGIITCDDPFSLFLRDYGFLQTLGKFLIAPLSGSIQFFTQIIFLNFIHCYAIMNRQIASTSENELYW